MWRESMFFLYMVEWLFPRELRRRGLKLSIGPRFLCSAKCLPDNHLFFALWFVFSITWKGKWFGIFYFHVFILNPNWKTKTGGGLGMRLYFQQFASYPHVSNLHWHIRSTISLASFPGSHIPEREHWSCAGVESLVVFSREHRQRKKGVERS